MSMTNPLKPSLKSIVSSFQDTVDKLTRLIDANKKAVSTNVTKINKLELENSNNNLESSKAGNIRTKILDLIA